MKKIKNWYLSFISFWRTVFTTPMDYYYYFFPEKGKKKVVPLTFGDNSSSTENIIFYVLLPAIAICTNALIYLINNTKKHVHLVNKDIPIKKIKDITQDYYDISTPPPLTDTLVDFGLSKDKGAFKYSAWMEQELEYYFLKELNFFDMKAWMSQLDKRINNEGTPIFEQIKDYTEKMCKRHLDRLIEQKDKQQYSLDLNSSFLHFQRKDTIFCPLDYKMLYHGRYSIPPELWISYDKYKRYIYDSFEVKGLNKWFHDAYYIGDKTGGADDANSVRSIIQIELPKAILNHEVMNDLYISTVFTEVFQRRIEDPYSTWDDYTREDALIQLYGDIVLKHVPFSESIWENPSLVIMRGEINKNVLPLMIPGKYKQMTHNFFLESRFRNLFVEREKKINIFTDVSPEDIIFSTSDLNINIILSYFLFWISLAVMIFTGLFIFFYAFQQYKKKKT